MFGSFITRGLVLIFSFGYPAYECYKTVEYKPDIEQLLFWCQYWIIVASLTICEWIGYMFIGGVPLYTEAKLAFFIYLWFPRTKGTTYVYDSFFKPYVKKHEDKIDNHLAKLRTRLIDTAQIYWQAALSYAQIRLHDILLHIASQPNSTPPTQTSQVLHELKTTTEETLVQSDKMVDFNTEEVMQLKSEDESTRQVEVTEEPGE